MTKWEQLAADVETAREICERQGWAFLGNSVEIKSGKLFDPNFVCPVCDGLMFVRDQAGDTVPCEDCEGTGQLEDSKSASEEPAPIGDNKLVAPTVHLNGSAKRDLLTQYFVAHQALEEALTRMRAATPHGRDYYVQDLGAFERAITQHEERCSRIQALSNEVMDLYHLVNAQD